MPGASHSDVSQLKVPARTDDHAQGDANAPATLIEYGDYQCPACRAAYPLVKDLQRRHPADLRFVFRNFPLTQAHPLAQLAAQLAEAAATLGKFWPMHDWLYENQEAWSDGDGAELLSGARRLDIDAEELKLAMGSPDIARRIRSDFTSGVRSGVSGTPGFFVNGVLYTGVSPSVTQAVENAVARGRTY
jgi:protein-disulfide isomerase